MSPHKNLPEFHAYDSEYAEEYPGHRRYAVAYEPFWQWIRFNLQWATYDHVGDSCAICDAYVAATSDAEELKNRVWRVYNLLCAIPHGQSTKIGIRIVERSVTTVLAPYTIRYHTKMIEKGYPEIWDWTNVRNAAEVMQQTQPRMLEKTTKHLLQARSGRPEPKPELRHYLRICLDAMGIDEPLEIESKETK